MGRRKRHQSEEDHREAAKMYRKSYYEKNKVTILQKMRLKYNTMNLNSAQNDELGCGSDPDTRFRKLINGSTRRFLDNMTLEYIAGNLSDESRQPIRDALDIAQEAEDAFRASGDDGTEYRQVILSLEDVLLRVFEDEDIGSAHSRGLLSYKVKFHIFGSVTPAGYTYHKIFQKMVASEWTSKEQKEWLAARLSGYLKCSTKASYAKFWPPVYEQWEEQWPIHKELWPDLPESETLNAIQSELKGKAVKKRQKQLRTWMLWHSGRSASRKARVAQSSTRATRLLKNLLQPWAVQAAISECGSTTRGERLTIVRDMARQCWERETDETVIADVKGRMKAKKTSKKSNEDGEDDEALEDDDEEEEVTMEDVLEFSFLVLMGGPDPSNNNKISVSSVDVGTTKLGHSAPQCLPDFKENFLGTRTRQVNPLQCYTSPEPEGQSDTDAADEGEAEDKDNADLEDQDEVDADPFADEPEDELEASEGRPEGDVLDRELDGKRDGRKRMPDIYSPNYAETMHGTLQPVTMHDSFQDTNMHGSVQPEDRSTFQNINMHGSVQPEDHSNLAMHDGNPYFMNTTNFNGTGTGAYPADLNIFGDLNYWTPAPGLTGQYNFVPRSTGQYNSLENLQTFGQVPSYPPHPSDALPPLPPVPNSLENFQTFGQVPSYPQHPSDTLPPLPPVPSGNSPTDLDPPHALDSLPTLPPVPSGNCPANPSPSDTSPLLPPAQDTGSGAKESGAKASGAKASGAKASGAKASGVKVSSAKASGAKASRTDKPEVPEVPTHQAETMTRKSACPPKPSTRNETANAIGAQALSELREKENAPSEKESNYWYRGLGHTLSMMTKFV
ncbi:hypothetical protein EDB19DRAFT_1831361 [Suillus lakei]|nr:hypothetical protein EDB19DRAFT_1831361 [Suillus lakei]